MNEMTNKYDNPILICIGSYKDFHDDGELFCGGCGYQYSPDEAEDMFKDVKIKVANTCGMEIHTKPLHCIRCCRQYESVYFSDLGEVSKIVPLSLFKNRYINKLGELILPKKFETPVFIPSWDFNVQRRVSYADAIAYMLHSLGYAASNMTLHVGPESWELYSGILRISRGLHEDICNISEKSLRFHLGDFDKILASMRDMENDRFFSIGGNENE
jgi:hypothetical protein